MQATPQRNTRPELALRRELHSLGLRYFVHRRPIRGLRREADVVFPRTRVAVFVDSCFWHGCPEHVTWPTANAPWWRAKINSTRTRDHDTDQRLANEGWVSLRIWEHDDPQEAARRIESLVRERRRDA
jgi:DNA mismatch endonuclease, patch repair protein